MMGFPVMMNDGLFIMLLGWVINLLVTGMVVFLLLAMIKTIFGSFV